MQTLYRPPSSAVPYAWVYPVLRHYNTPPLTLLPPPPFYPNCPINTRKKTQPKHLEERGGNWVKLVLLYKHGWHPCMGWARDSFLRLPKVAQITIVPPLSSIPIVRFTMGRKEIACQSSTEKRPNDWYIFDSRHPSKGHFLNWYSSRRLNIINWMVVIHSSTRQQRPKYGQTHDKDLNTQAFIRVKIRP